MATFQDVADVPLDQAAKQDGISIVPSFENQQWRPDRSLIWHFPYYHPERTYSSAIEKVGINDFATSKTRPQSAIRIGQHKLIQFAEDDRIELYDLESDVSEQRDLSVPEADLAAKMKRLLNKQLDTQHARRALPR